MQALSGGPLVQARNFAVMTGVNAGISCVMKRLRGKEDVQSRSDIYDSILFIYHIFYMSIIYILLYSQFFRFCVYIKDDV